MQVNISDRQIAYSKTGRGPIHVLLVHGGPGLTRRSLSSIHNMLDQDQYTVFSYNQSGSSGNENAPFHKSVAAYAIELNQMIEALKIDRPFLVGHSWGTAVVLEFLFTCPNSPIRGIALINCFVSGVQLASWIENRISKLPQAFHDAVLKLNIATDAAKLDALLGQYWFPQHVIRSSELPSDLLQDLAELGTTPIYYYYIGWNPTTVNGAILSWDRSTDLKNIKVPALVVSGGFDYGERSDFDQIAGAIPNATTWFDPETSHFPMLEKPAGFKEVLTKFLSSTK